VGTGIELSLVSADAYNALERGSVPGDFAIEAQLFTDVDDDGRRYRVGGLDCSERRLGVLPAGSDPTTMLVAIAKRDARGLGRSARRHEARGL
jgi:hypothetical protein